MYKFQISLGLVISLALCTQQNLVRPASAQSYSAGSIAQPATLERTFQVAQQSGTTIFIAPNGKDAAGSGTQAQPFRTIAAALNTNLQPGTVIQLAPGTYSTESGEVFPLKLQPGIILRGNVSTKGQGVLIKGGGMFISPTFARQNIAMLAAHGAQIEGITLTNSGGRGYALWVESSNNVAISNNSFIGSTHDGVFLTGSASVTVLDNLFSKNRGSGISALGTSSGEIRDNTFDSTGFGLSIGQRSWVQLTNNRIINNVDGIVISNRATPILRGNLIANSQRNGLVVLKDRNGQPTPDLGTTSSPGKNVFKGNKQKDINNASGVSIVAAGNEIDKKRVEGPLDFTASSSPIAAPQPTVPVAPPSMVKPESPQTSPKSVLPPSNNGRIESHKTTIPVAPPLPTSTVLVAPVKTAQPTNSPANTKTQSRQPGPGSVIVTRDLPPAKPTPAKGTRISQSENKSAPPVAKSIPIATTPRYRVIALISAETSTDRVRHLFPKAIASKRNGQTVLQVGAYSERGAADAQVKKLAQSGVKAAIEVIR